MSYKKELDNFGKETTKELVLNYIKMGLRALGTFERGLVYETTDGSIEIKAPLHARVMETGRRAGKFPPMDDILKWVKLGKIVKRDNIKDEQLAFLIARKIAREGIKVPNKHNAGKVISSVLLDGRINALLEEIEQKESQNVSEEIFKFYEKA